MIKSRTNRIELKLNFHWIIKDMVLIRMTSINLKLKKSHGLKNIDKYRVAVLKILYNISKLDLILAYILTILFLHIELLLLLHET